MPERARRGRPLTVEWASIPVDLAAPATRRRRRERGCLSIVCPPALARGALDKEDTMRRCIVLDVHLESATSRLGKTASSATWRLGKTASSAPRSDRHGARGAELFADSLASIDEVAIEASLPSTADLRRAAPADLRRSPGPDWGRLPCRELRLSVLRVRLHEQGSVPGVWLHDRPQRGRDSLRHLSARTGASPSGSRRSTRSPFERLSTSGRPRRFPPCGAM